MIKLKENIKLAKKYLNDNKITPNDLKLLLSIDPSSNKKYIGWLTKIWINEKPDFNELKNIIEEYNNFVNRRRTNITDINSFKTFNKLKDEVNKINNQGDSLSNKDLEKDYDIIKNNNNLLIMCPHTHEASRKLGLSHFSFRECPTDKNKKDSSWCTTYKSPDHFNDYYYSQNVTFYYIKIKSPIFIKQLKDKFNNFERFIVVALVVNENGKIKGYDGLDNLISQNELNIYLSLIGLK